MRALKAQETTQYRRSWRLKLIAIFFITLSADGRKKGFNFKNNAHSKSWLITVDSTIIINCRNLKEACTGVKCWYLKSGTTKNSSVIGSVLRWIIGRENRFRKCICFWIRHETTNDQPNLFIKAFNHNCTCTMYSIRKLPSIHYTHCDELYVLYQIEFADKGVTKTQQMQETR